MDRHKQEMSQIVALLARYNFPRLGRITSQTDYSCRLSIEFFLLIVAFIGNTIYEFKMEAKRFPEIYKLRREMSESEGITCTDMTVELLKRTKVTGYTRLSKHDVLFSGHWRHYERRGDLLFALFRYAEQVLPDRAGAGGVVVAGVGAANPTGQEQDGANEGQGQEGQQRRESCRSEPELTSGMESEEDYNPDNLIVFD